MLVHDTATHEYIFHEATLKLKKTQILLHSVISKHERRN